MREYMAVSKALADENRARILVFLGQGELCVCEIIEMLGLAPSTVSKHLNILYRAGLLDSRKQGRWVYYRLAHEGPCVRPALGFLNECLAGTAVAVNDAKKLKAVRKMTADELCCRYKS